MYFSVLSAVMIVIQGPIMSTFSPKVSEKPLIAIGSPFMFVSSALLTNHNIIFIYSPELQQ